MVRRLPVSANRKAVRRMSPHRFCMPLFLHDQLAVFDARYLSQGHHLVAFVFQALMAGLETLFHTYADAHHGGLGLLHQVAQALGSRAVGQKIVDDEHARALGR